MPTGSALSSVYTLQDVVNRVLNRMGKSEPDESALLQTIIAEINAQQKELAKRLRTEQPLIRELYMQKATLTWTNSERSFPEIEAASPVVIEIDRVEAYNSDGSKWGTIPNVDPASFNNLHGLTFFDKNMAITIEQRRIKLFTGQDMDSSRMTFYVYYIREANTLNAMTDYMDLPDNYINELTQLVIQVLQPNKVEDNK